VAPARHDAFIQATIKLTYLLRQKNKCRSLFMSLKGEGEGLTLTLCEWKHDGLGTWAQVPAAEVWSGVALRLNLSRTSTHMTAWRIFCHIKT
jgi:hypothetical protein